MRIVRGHGRLAGPGRVEVDGTTYDAALGVVLNTGTEPAVAADRRPRRHAVLDQPRGDARRPRRPESLVVLGGGPIGCELAQAFARFGDAGDAGRGARTGSSARRSPRRPRSSRGCCARDGIDVRTGVRARRGCEHDGGFRSWTSTATTLERRRSCSSPPGARPNLADIGLETVGLDPTREHVETDERMRAGERLWAVGDITGKGAFTHVVDVPGARSPSRDLLGEDGPWADYRAVSRVTFTDPEVGAVGLTEEQAREAGPRGSRSGTPTSPSRSRGWIHEAATRASIKVVADADRGVLVGATVGRRRPAARCSACWPPPCTPRSRSRRCAGCTSPTRRSTGRSKPRWPTWV